MKDIALALFALAVSGLCLAAGAYQIYAGHISLAVAFLLVSAIVSLAAFEMARRKVQKR